MKERVGQIASGQKKEFIWFLEHPPIYTAGSSAKSCDLINQNNLPVFNVGRGGQYTYHGPGQRIVYIMLDLKKRDMADLKMYISKLQKSIMCTLKAFGLDAFTKKEHIGVWVKDLKGQTKKIAAIGIRITKWITYHGLAINIDPDLLNYKGIVPCGIKEFGITSLKALGLNIKMEEFDQILALNLKKILL